VTTTNRIDIDEKLRGDSAICKRGVETDFWRLVKDMMYRLREEAKDTLVLIDPSDISGVSQLQATAKVVEQLITVVEDTARLT
jgi:hypothetical protein